VIPQILGVRIAEVTGVSMFLVENDVGMERDPGTDRVSQQATKSKRADEVPLSSYISQQLRAARPALLLPTARVFKRVPTFNTWKGDLTLAGISYHDAEKRIAGFHSLRVTLGTELERIGTPRAVRHWIMRHVDPSLSYSSYVDRERLDAWEVVNRLPTYPLPTPHILRKTGTA
jgi:hypothetical protein